MAKWSFLPTVLCTVHSRLAIHPLVPNLGLLYEHNGASELNNAKINLSGRSLLQAAAGVGVWLQKKLLSVLILSCRCRKILPEGQTHSKVKGMVHITFCYLSSGITIVSSQKIKQMKKMILAVATFVFTACNNEKKKKTTPATE